MKKILLSLLILGLAWGQGLAGTITFNSTDGNWNDDTKWIGGAKPSTNDNVTFNATSGNCIINADTVNVWDFNCTGYTKNITHNVGVTLSVIGDFTLVPGMNYTALADNSTISFVRVGVGSTENITTSGKLLGNIKFGATNTSACNFSLWDNVTQRSTTASVTLLSGTLHTDGASDNSNLTHTWGGFNSTANTRTLTLGNSTINITGNLWYITSTGSPTINANTSTINMLGITNDFYTGSGKVWNNVNQLGGTSSQILLGGTISNYTNSGTSLNLNGNYNILNQLKLSGINSTKGRFLVKGSVLGIQNFFNITGATLNISNVDFRDINFINGSLPVNLSANSTGDCGGNTNITFTPAVQQNWTCADGGNWSNSSCWTSRVPLPQDDVSLALAFNPSKTVTADMPRLGRTIDWTGSTGTSTTWTLGNAVTSYGSIILRSGMAWGGAYDYSLEGRSGDFILSTSGVVNTIGSASGIIFTGIGSDFNFGDSYSGNSLRLSNGNLSNVNNFDIIATAFISTSTSTCKFDMGTANYFFTGSTPWDATGTGFTLLANNSNIQLNSTTATAKTFSGGNKTYGNFTTLGATGAGILTISGNNTFNTFNIQSPKQVNITSNTTQTVTSLKANGTSGNAITLNSSVAGYPGYINSSNNQQCNWLNISDVSAGGTGSFYAGKNSLNLTNATGWKFYNAPGNDYVNFTGNMTVKGNINVTK